MVVPIAVPLLYREVRSVVPGWFDKKTAIHYHPSANSQPLAEGVFYGKVPTVVNR